MTDTTAPIAIFFAALSAIAAAAAVPVAIFAAYLSKQADSRSMIGARTQVYLALRSRFIEVHSSLPAASYTDLNWLPSTIEEQGQATRYWHHAFDEWYITTQLDAKLLGVLWKGFFAQAILSALRHPGLRLHLQFLMTQRKEHDALWRDFGVEIQKLWQATHPDGSRCQGLACQH